MEQKITDAIKDRLTRDSDKERSNREILEAATLIAKSISDDSKESNRTWYIFIIASIIVTSQTIEIQFIEPSDMVRTAFSIIALLSAIKLIGIKVVDKFIDLIKTWRAKI